MWVRSCRVQRKSQICIGTVSQAVSEMGNAVMALPWKHLHTVNKNVTSLTSAVLGAESSVPEISETWCSCSSSVFACFLLQLTLSNLCWNLWLWLAPQSVCVCMYAHSDCALGSILQNGTMLGFRRLVSVTVIEVTVYKHREGEKSCSVFCLTQWYSLDECVCS